MCDESDGDHIYQHYQWTVSVHADGHGTFEAITETGIRRQTGLYKTRVELPHGIQIKEIHGSLNIVSWCDNNGVLAKWDAFSPAGVSEVVGGKTFQFHSGDSANFVIPQIVFPQPLPATALQLSIYNDLCATSTVSWVFQGSF